MTVDRHHRSDIERFDKGSLDSYNDLLANHKHTDTEMTASLWYGMFLNTIIDQPVEKEMI